MSGLAGVFQRQGAPAQPERLQRFAASLTYRGTMSPALAGSVVGLVGTRLQSTDSGLLVAFDGRLDDPDDDCLGSIQRAYRRWGNLFAAHLIGEFALALWDPARQVLLLIRDYVGARPLHYYLDDEVLLFASDVPTLLSEPEVPHRPNQSVMAEYLTFHHLSAHETLYERIHRVPPGHVLVVEPAGSRLLPYWQPPTGPMLELSDEREYEERFRHLLTQAIRARAGDACLMSGGLDSTSVAVLANVPTFSLIFPGSDCDESGYIDDVVSAAHLTSKRLVPQPPGPERLTELVIRDRLPPLAPNYTMVEDLCRTAAHGGFRRLLTGQGGDHAMMGHRLYYADLLSQGRWSALHAALRADYGDDSRRAWIALRQYALAPLLPANLLTTYRRLRHGRPSIWPPWLTGDFLENADLPRRRQRAEELFQPIPDYTRREYYRNILGAETSYSLESNERCAAWTGTTLLHPFLDQRLTDFCFHVPPQQWLRGHQTKDLLRRAMNGRLPDSVRLRNDKAEFSSFVIACLRSLPLEFWRERSRLAELNVINVESLQSTFEALIREDDTGERRPYHLLGPLWEACSLELWLRGEFGK